MWHPMSSPMLASSWSVQGPSRTRSTSLSPPCSSVPPPQPPRICPHVSPSDDWSKMGGEREREDVGMGCARAGLLFPLPVAQLARVVNSTLSPKMGMRGEIGEPLLKALWVMRRTCTTLFLMKSLLLINYGETWIVNTYPYFLSVTALLSSALSSRLPNHGFYSFLLPPSRTHASSASPSPLSPPSQTLA
jgi:hypothetical protein